MLDWKVYALTTPIFFVGYQSLAKLLPRDVSVFLITAYAMGMGFVIMLMLHFISSTTKSGQLQAKHLLLALGIGTLISFGNWGIIKAYGLGAPQSLFSPVFYVALIVYGIIFGLFFWQERLNLPQAGGILLACTGIAITMYFRK